MAYFKLVLFLVQIIFFKVINNFKLWFYLDRLISEFFDIIMTF